MKKISFLAVIAILFITSSAAQNPKRTVLYKLAPGETILYGEYMVDFDSPNKNYVATIIKKSDADDWYGNGHIYHAYKYASAPYDIVINGERRNFSHGRDYPVYRPEKVVSTSGWDDVVYVWHDRNGYYVRFNGLIYGPYENEPDLLPGHDAAVVEQNGEYLFLQNGKEEKLHDMGIASMPFEWDSKNANRYNGLFGNYLMVEGNDGNYIMTVNDKSIKIKDRGSHYGFTMSQNGTHWIYVGFYDCTVYVDGMEMDIPANVHSSAYIDNSGNYIYEAGGGFVINGRKVAIPMGAEKCRKIYFGSNNIMRFYSNFGYRYKGDLYVFDGKGFSKTQGKSYNNAFYPENTNGLITLISGDRRHMMIYGWEAPHVQINGKRYGSAPALRAEWNDKTQSFHWNALEGQELVVYEFKP